MLRRPVILFDPHGQLNPHLSDYFSSNPHFQMDACCPDMAAFCAALDEHKPAVIFAELDFDSPGSLLTALQQNARNAAVIFVSSNRFFPAYIADPFTIGILGRPLMRTHVDNLLEKYLHIEWSFGKIAPPQPAAIFPRRLLIEKGKRHASVSVSEITYFEANLDNTHVHTIHNSRFITNTGISGVEKKLDPSKFLRVHRSFIVNIDHIKGGYRDISKFFISLPNEVEISVGRKYYPAIREMMF